MEVFKIKEFFILCFLFLGITFSGYSLDIQASIEKEFQRAQPEPGYDSAARGVITFELYNDNPDDLYNYFIFQTYDDDISCDGWLTRAQVINKTNPYFDWQDPKCYFRWYRPYYGWEPVSAVQISLDCTVNWRSWESKGPILRCKLGIMKNGEVVYIGVPKPGFEVAKHFKYPTKQDKEQFIEKMFKTNDENMQKEYESIINSLKEKAGKDKEVREQLEEWQMIYNTKFLWKKTVNVDNLSTRTLERFSDN